MLSEFGHAIWIYEIRPFLLTLALIRRGFRSRSVPGWSYSRSGMIPVVFIVMACLTVPQALVLDLLFSHSEALRAASAIIHLYAVVWLFAFAESMQSEPHAIHDGQALFHFPLLQSVAVRVTDIRTVECVHSRPRGVPRFGLGLSGIVLHLEKPVRISRPFFAPSPSKIFVAADDPHSLVLALASSE